MGNSLINLGNLSKPATVLIEKISDAVGIIYEPHRIRQRALAEVDAKAIHALGDIKIREVSKRALMRLVQEETRKQENIESITAKAIPQLSESSNPQNIENDWLLNFFDKCKVISNEDMQKMWAKVLASEANTPNSFSKRTVDTLAMMSKDEAEFFMRLCKFSWKLAGYYCPIIFDIRNAIYNKEGIDFQSINHLEAIGLVTLNHITGYNRAELPKTTIVEYFNNRITLQFLKDKGNELPIGHVLFTQVGHELRSICSPEEDASIVDYVKAKWKEQGILSS